MSKKQTSTVPPNVRNAIAWVEKRFARAQLYFGHGTDNARDEAAWLVASLMAIPFDRLDQSASRALTTADWQQVQAMTEARVETRQPLAYLLKEAWFAGLKFYVDERVLVPRSLIGDFIRDRFRPWLADGQVPRILDLCSGSGCIAIAAALAFPEAQVDASDISLDALDVARRNIQLHALGARVRLLPSDLFAGLAGQRYSLILTNPPYVDSSDMASLPEEYRHEPALALASGTNGLTAIIRILAEASEHLEPDGVLIAEVGNSCVALQRRFPDIAFTWLSSASGDESVFLLTAAEIKKYRDRFEAVSRVQEE